MAIETHDLLSFLCSIVSKMVCNQRYPTNLENSNTKCKINGIFSNSIDEII